MPAVAAIIEQIRPLVTQLDDTERLALIRSIALIEPTTVENDQALDERSRQMLAEQEAWFARPTSERTQYRSQFIAILAGNVIDQDVDQRALLLRVRQRFGEAPMPILAGEWDATPEYTFLSPRLTQ